MKSRLLLISLFISTTLVAQEIFIDKGVCPGEGCMYKETWTADRSIQLRSAPDSSSEIVTTLSKGDSVKTITGEVHTMPGEFIVHRAHDEFSPGDKVFVYTYLGEGYFKLNHNGELKNASLGFSPWGGSSGKRCEADKKRCWGTLKDEIKSFWWVKVKTQSGVEGWILDKKGFSRPRGLLE